MKEPPEPSFEEALAQLESIVRTLEQGSTGLEESLRLFEEGTRLLGLCHRRLDEAEGRVAKLIRGEGGDVREEPWAEGHGSSPDDAGLAGPGGAAPGGDPAR
ncbi:MAG: exodeoxyribonuclease VII small subunit [Bacillota bacterium]